MPFVFQQLPSSVAPIIVSFVQNNGALWSLASTNKSNFILTSVRRQQYYRSFCFQGAKSLLKQLHERYGKQLLKNACVSFLSTNSSIGLTDIDDILQLLNVNEETQTGTVHLKISCCGLVTLDVTIQNSSTNWSNIS